MDTSTSKNKDPRPHVRVRFLVGTDSNLDIGLVGNTQAIHERQTARTKQARERLQRWFPFGAFYEGTGVWKGRTEGCWYFETIVPLDYVTVYDLQVAAQAIARVMGQECVGVETQEVQYMEVWQ